MLELLTIVIFCWLSFKLLGLFFRIAWGAAKFIAFVLFVIIHVMNKLSKLGKKPEPPKAPTTRKCPYCLSEIPIEATKCAHCTSDVPPVEA